ncbi:MAG: DNA polymerase III subunit gamma/tau [Saprospiraceae bacterium]|nr:DNA polymerase III subunit gamma/tau [Saprospiraceae bacterium]
MAFVVSARKYRPVHFEDVVGQAHVSQTLKKALQTDHVAHAFLFCGPRGVGKTTCARILAKVLNCQNVTANFEPCGECESCRAFSENASFNIMELDAASNNSVEHIRTLVEQVRFQPQQGKYKVFIIDEVHMLSQAAFNAFLKTLEEPPSYAIFILATTEKHKIIPTILSRCQIFDFKRIQVGDTVAHLQKICDAEGIEAEGDALHIIAQKADGALRDALSIFDRITSASGKKITYEDVITNLNVLDYDYFFRLTDALLTEDLRQVLLIHDSVLRNGFEGDHFINGLAEHLRNLLVCKDAETLRLLEVSDNLRERYRQQAALAPASFLLTALNLCNDCDINYKMARQKPLHVELYLIKMCYANQAVQLASSGQQQAVGAEKKTPDVSSPVGSSTVGSGQSVPRDATNSSSIAKQSASAQQPSNGPPPPGYAEVVPPTPVESVTVKEPPIEPVAPPQTGLLRKTGIPGLSSVSLQSIHDEIAEAEANNGPVQAPKLNLEDLREAWSAYIDSIDKDSVKAMLRGADIDINPEQVTVTVGSALAENTVRQETMLMDFLRKRLHAPLLALTIKLDPSRSNAAPAKPKRLTDSEKYHAMRAVNPLVDEVRKRFDLSLENE